MKSLKSAAVRGAVISATALSALALASCSAGHIAQTAQKVIAVDGSHATTEDGAIVVQDVTILLEPGTNSAALKFSAINDGYRDGKITLDSIDVDGQKIPTTGLLPIGREQSIVGNSADNLKAIKQLKSQQVQYLPTSLKNAEFGYAGTRPVTFTFSNGTITLDAPISASPLKSGSYDRNVETVPGFTTEGAQPTSNGEKSGHGEHGAHGDHSGHGH